MAEHLFAGLRCSELEDLAPAFVLGALEPAEMDAIRQHLAACPEAHPEMAELGSVVPALFETVELVEPPAGLKARILAAAAADTQRVADSQRAVGTQLAPAATPPPIRPASSRPVADDRPSSGWASLFRRPVWAAVSLGAVIAVLALGAWNLQLRDELSGLNDYRAGVTKVLDQAAQPGALIAVLTSEGGQGPSGLAAVAADGSVALVMRDLAPTQGSQVYETWLIGADGAPIPIGGFTATADGSASFVGTHATLGEGVTVALTLEPAPGATAPTLPIVAAGVARSQAS